MLPCTSFARILLFCHTALFPPSPLFHHSIKRIRKNLTLIFFLREQLREQHELTQEIGNAITSMPITEPVDEDELQADLDKLEQEALDEKMLRTGTVPVADSLSNRLPAGPTGASTSLLFLPPLLFFLFLSYFAPLPSSFAIPTLPVITSTLTKAGVCVVFSSTVKGKSKAAEEDEEAELAKLQAEMAM